MKEQNKAYILTLITILIWSTVGSAFKLALRYINFIQLLFLSSFVSSISIFIILFFQRKIKIIFNCLRTDILHSAVLGFLNPFLYYLVLFKAYSILPAQEAITLNYTWPIMLVLLSIPILKQKIKLISIFAIIISFLGVILIATEGNIVGIKFSNFAGDLLPLGSAVIWALFWIYNIKDSQDAVIKLFLIFLRLFLYFDIQYFSSYRSECFSGKSRGNNLGRICGFI